MESWVGHENKVKFNSLAPKSPWRKSQKDTVSTYLLNGNFFMFSSLLSKVQIQAQIDDSHVVKILDTVSVTETRQLFIVMELCEGGNLFQWIQRNRKHKMLNETVSSASGVLMTVRDM